MGDMRTYVYSGSTEHSIPGIPLKDIPPGSQVTVDMEKMQIVQVTPFGQSIPIQHHPDQFPSESKQTDVPVMMVDGSEGPKDIVVLPGEHE